MKQQPSPASTSDLAEMLRARSPARRSRLALILAGAALLPAIGVWSWLRAHDSGRTGQPAFTTGQVQRGDVSLTITATGNLEPTNEVTVGSELSGTVLEVYVDTNDRVTRGQPLAKLDTSKLQQQTESTRAAARSAKAQVAEAEATLGEDEATLARQEELNRISNGKAPSRSDLETARAAAERARASLQSAQAALAEAEAQVQMNESDLGKAVIKSPIDGIVLTRSIEPGQTVAASFTAPELFVIAENLAHMKLKVKIAEADIARVDNGQRATFTVDAWPDRTYSANVIKVAYGSAVSDNVVTYQTELEVTNDDLSLRPGMTATADIRVAESWNVLLVPTAALRFDPGASMAAGGPPGTPQGKTFVQSILPMPPRMPRRPAGNAEETPKGRPGGGQIWVLREGVPQPVPVKTGISDGRRTEIAGEGIAEGMAVILRASGLAK